MPENKITCIVGPSGCGKTSILNILAGIIKLYEGISNTESNRISYIFQEDRLLPWETLYQNIRLVREEEDKEEIINLLEALELIDFKDKYPHQLSGGMRQRCSIARGFYYNSDLLLMDEPFKSLDYDLKLNLLNYLGGLWVKNKKTIIFVTHDIDEALLLGHEIVVLSKRPTVILDTYLIDTKLGNRDVNQKQHIIIRNKIINHMTNKLEKERIL